MNLKGKVGGLPKWAWLTLLAGGLGIGIYLRMRSTGEEENPEPEEGFEVPPPDTLAAYEETPAGGGLQALGVAGPAATRSYPVEAPYVPEGFTSTIENQGDTVQSLSNGILELSGIQAEQISSLLSERPKEVIRERIAGPPKRPTTHKPPKKPKQKKPAKKAPVNKGKKKKGKGKK